MHPMIPTLAPKKELLLSGHMRPTAHPPVGVTALTGSQRCVQTIDQGNLIQNTVDLKGCTTGNCETPLVVQGQGNTQKNTVGIKQVG